jgi:hypothetical protein
VIDEIAAREWAELIAELVPPRRIDRDGAAYLERHELAGYYAGYRGRPIPALYLHHFLASDPREQVHSHPWSWATSLVLAGGYLEHRCDDDGRRETRELRPGDLNVLLPGDRRRIELLEPDCWTLFLAGPYAQAWAFEEAC